MQTPKQFIEDIRKRRFAIGLPNNIPEDVRKHIEDGKNFKKDASRLASDIHTEKPHFILELIQNAEDNDYFENAHPKIKFIIREDVLILQNNEKGVNEKNVEALCGIGATTKENKKLGYIGEKGIGFKSVFMVTDNPQIYSNGFQFEFRYDEKDPTSIIIPHWVDNLPDFVESDKTNIVLPLKEEAKKELKELIEFTKIDPNLLLFLRKLRNIEIENRIQNKSEIIKRHELDGKVIIECSKGKYYWKIVKNPEPLKVPDYVREEKRRDVTETEIALAFPLEPNGLTDISTEQKVFVYLPIRSYGFKFIIQADFLVPPSREDIIKDESTRSWNKWIRNNIAFVFLRAVEEFKQDANLRKTYYNYIPLSNEVTDSFFSPVVEQIYGLLGKTECILTESGNWLKPADIFLADDKIRRLVSNKDLKNFFGKEYISPEVKAKREILRSLGVQTFECNHLLQCLQKNEWLDKQTDEWFTWLYEYLNNQKLEEKQFNVLTELKIIRLENNELVSISEGNIFLLSDGKGDYGFEEELRIVKRNLLGIKEKRI